jgi:hypothetical protein
MRGVGVPTHISDIRLLKVLAVMVRSSKHQCKISANKVNKLEEWLLAPPVYSLRGTHACDEVPFAEPSRAEHTRDCYNV